MHIKVIKLSEKNESYMQKNPRCIATPGSIYHLKKYLLHFLGVFQELSQTDVSQRVFQQTQD